MVNKITICKQDGSDETYEISAMRCQPFSPVSTSPDILVLWIIGGEKKVFKFSDFQYFYVDMESK